MSDFYIFTCAEVLDILTKNPSALVIKAKANGGTGSNNSLFYDVTLNGKPFWLSVEGIHVTRGVADPSSETDVRVKPDEKGNVNKMQFQIETTLAKSGLFGEVITLLSKLFEAWAEGFKKSNPLYAKRIICDMMQTMIKTGTNAGKQLESPNIRIKYDLDTKLSEKFPIRSLQRQPATTVFETRLKDPNDLKSEVIYNDIAKLGETNTPINNSTMYQLVDAGAYVHAGRINMMSVSITTAFISWSMHFNRIAIVKAPVIKLPDDDAYTIIKPSVESEMKNEEEPKGEVLDLKGLMDGL